jgi:hypothetical protein
MSASAVWSLVSAYGRKGVRAYRKGSTFTLDLDLGSNSPVGFVQSQARSHAPTPPRRHASYVPTSQRPHADTRLQKWR